MQAIIDASMIALIQARQAVESVDIPPEAFMLKHETCAVGKQLLLLFELKIWSH